MAIGVVVVYLKQQKSPFRSISNALFYSYVLSRMLLVLYWYWFSGPEVLFMTCVAMKFVDDDDDDDDTSSSAIADRSRGRDVRVGQFWPKVEDDILQML